MSRQRSPITDRETERIVRSWLAEGTARLPDRVLDAVLDGLPTTQQRRAWWPAWRSPRMSNPMRLAIAAIAVTIVAFLAINILPGRFGGIGGPAATPSPTPVPTGEAAATLLADIVFAADAAPPGMSHDKTTTGQIVLARPFVSREVDAAILTQPGFVDGRYAEFSNSEAGLLSWAVLYETIADAERGFALYRNEVEAEAGYGVEPGAPADLGDEGFCGAADAAADATKVCLWRAGGLVLAVGTYGPIDLATVRQIASDMDDRIDAQQP